MKAAKQANQTTEGTRWGPFIQRQCSHCAEKQEEEAPFISPSRVGRVQTKLAVGAPNDIYEQEADRIADQVMAMPAHGTIRRSPIQVQRVTESSSGQTTEAPASVERVLSSPGQPLEPGLREEMEGRFGGHDFSGVRIHAGPEAEQSVRDMGAHAYTLGHDIVFQTGKFSPHTHSGRKLIAHELTHVMHQTSYNTPIPFAGNARPENKENRFTQFTNIRSSQKTNLVQRDIEEERTRTEEIHVSMLELRRHLYEITEPENASVPQLLSSASVLEGLLIQYHRHPSLAGESAEIADSLLRIYDELRVRAGGRDARSQNGELIYIDYYNIETPGGVAIPWMPSRPHEVEDIPIFNPTNVAAWRMLIEWQSIHPRVPHTHQRFRGEQERQEPQVVGSNEPGTHERDLLVGEDDISNREITPNPNIEVLATPTAETPAEQIGRTSGFLSLQLGLNRLESRTIQEIMVAAQQYVGNLRSAGESITDVQIIEGAASRANLLSTCSVIFYVTRGPFPRMYALDRSGHILNSSDSTFAGSYGATNMTPGVYYATRILTDSSQSSRGMVFTFLDGSSIDVLEGLEYGDFYFEFLLRDAFRFRDLVRQAYANHRGVGLIVSDIDQTVFGHPVQNLFTALGYALFYLPWAIERTLINFFLDPLDTLGDVLLGMAQSKILQYAALLSGLTLAFPAMMVMLIGWFRRNIAETVIYASTEAELGFVGQSIALFITEEVLEEFIERGPGLASNWRTGRDPWNGLENEPLNTQIRSIPESIGTEQQPHIEPVPESQETNAYASQIPRMPDESIRSRAESAATEEVLPEESVPEGTVIIDPRPYSRNAAEQNYVNTILDDLGREAAIYFNPELGVYVVVQGDVGSVFLIESDGTHNALGTNPNHEWTELLDSRSNGEGQWQLLAHYHPNGSPFPSGGEGDFGVIIGESLRAGSNVPRRSHIDFSMLGTIRRSNFFFLPFSERPYGIEYPDPVTSDPIRVRFSRLQEYYDWFHQQTGGDLGEVPAWILDWENYRFLSESEDEPSLDLPSHPTSPSIPDTSPTSSAQTRLPGVVTLMDDNGQLTTYGLIFVRRLLRRRGRDISQISDAEVRQEFANGGYLLEAVVRREIEGAYSLTGETPTNFKIFNHNFAQVFTRLQEAVESEGRDRSIDSSVNNQNVYEFLTSLRSIDRVIDQLFTEIERFARDRSFRPDIPWDGTVRSKCRDFLNFRERDEGGRGRAFLLGNIGEKIPDIIQVALDFNQLIVIDVTAGLHDPVHSLKTAFYAAVLRQMVSNVTVQAGDFRSFLRQRRLDDLYD